MKHLPSFLASFLALVPTTLLATAAPARAEAPDQATRSDAMAAVSGGLELLVAASASHTVGAVGGGMDAADLDTARLGLQFGRRVTPNLTLGVYADGWAAASSSAGDAHVVALGLAADFHLRPGAALDPWFSVGGGARAMLIRDGAYSLLVGAELARLQAGVDLRATPELAIALVTGATASVYGAGKRSGAEFDDLPRNGVGWTLTAGVAGRFNLLATRRYSEAHLQ